MIGTAKVRGQQDNQEMMTVSDESPILEVTDLCKVFPAANAKGMTADVVAVDNVSLTAKKGQLFTLLGPSGCGKTTTLRSIAGLETPDSGRIVVAGRTLYDGPGRPKVAVNERQLGMVFQSYAIWPHLSVFKNVSFPLEVAPRARRLTKTEIRDRVESTLSVVQLDHLTTRQATSLSGGQQQRLALARALVLEPTLLLLDEPLSNLDAKLREEMRFELKRLQRELGITSIYVTHDQVEALAMSNVIAVMNHGVVEQIGSPRDVYERPKTKFVAEFIGTANFFEGRISQQDDVEGLVVTTELGRLQVRSSEEVGLGNSVVVSVRPEYIEITKGAPPETKINSWPGVVNARAFLGEAVDHLVSVEGREVRVRCGPSVSFPPGTDVTLTFREESCAVLPDG